MLSCSWRAARALSRRTPDGVDAAAVCRDEVLVAPRPWVDGKTRARRGHVHGIAHHANGPTAPRRGREERHGAQCLA